MIAWKRLARPAFVVCMVLLVGAAAGMNYVVSALEIHLRKQPIEAPEGRKMHALPAETASWVRVGDDASVSAEEMEELGTENFVTRMYRSKEAPPGRTEPVMVTLHLAYYTGMIEAVPHVPERCMVGHGWDLAELATPTLRVPVDVSAWTRLEDESREFGRSVYRARLAYHPYSDNPGGSVRSTVDPAGIDMRVSRFLNQTNGAQSFAGYFFIANGQTCSGAEGVRDLAFDLKADYAYFLKVQFDSPQATSHEELTRYAAMLLSELLPEIMRCVPDWAEVEAGRYPAKSPAGGGEGHAKGGAAGSGIGVVEGFGARVARNDRR
ncbi:MAG: exosortase-associated EpsI family protein [Phycisphaerales bacterium]|nr:exosortase-associated EpsI family protein [Phycisphaerales bacterium]